GLTACGWSLEWSRTEPEHGPSSRAQLDHYGRRCAAGWEHGVAPIVPFHHSTAPRWVAARGGWTEPVTAEMFARFCARATAHLGDLIARSCTLNEPNVVAAFGHRWGLFPPGLRQPDMHLRANDVMVAAHRLAVGAIKSGPGRSPVGLTLAIQDHQAVDRGEAPRAPQRGGMEDVFLAAARADDFLGVQTYTRLRIGPDGMRGPEPGVPSTQMGYEFWPEALEATLRRAWEVTRHVPLIVT